MDLNMIIKTLQTKKPLTFVKKKKKKVVYDKTI